jgi:hypothetical protein
MAHRMMQWAEIFAGIFVGRAEMAAYPREAKGNAGGEQLCSCSPKLRPRSYSMYRRPCRVQTRPNATTTRSSATSFPPPSVYFGILFTHVADQAKLFEVRKSGTCSKVQFCCRRWLLWIFAPSRPHKRCFPTRILLSHQQ